MKILSDFVGLLIICFMIWGAIALASCFGVAGYITLGCLSIAILTRNDE